MTAQIANLFDRRVGIDVALTKLSIGISPDQEMIGDLLLPPLPQDLASVKIITYGSEGYVLLVDDTGDWSEPQRVDLKLGKIQVDIVGHALATVVGTREAWESLKGPAQFDLALGKVNLVKQNMLLSRENAQGALIQNSTVYPAANVIDVSGTATNQFDNASSDPLDFLTPFIEDTFPNTTGKRPNTLWMGSQVWAQLITNVKLRAQIFGLNAPTRIPSKDQVAALFGVDRILVGRAISKDSTGAITRIWGKKAGLVWVPPVSGTEIPAFGYTPEQRVFDGSSEAIQRAFDEKLGPSGGWYIKRGAYYTPAITYAPAGILFTNVVT